MREGCAPGGPGTRRTAPRGGGGREDARAGRRGPGAVGNGGIVAYGARSPFARLGAQPAQACRKPFGIGPPYARHPAASKRRSRS